MGECVMYAISLNFLASTFVGSAWSFVISSRPMSSDVEGFSIYPRFYPLHLFSCLNSWFL